MRVGFGIAAAFAFASASALALASTFAFSATRRSSTSAVHPPHPFLPVAPIKTQKRKIALRFLLRPPLFGVLHIRQPLLGHIAAEEVPGGDRHAFNDPFA